MKTMLSFALLIICVNIASSQEGLHHQVQYLDSIMPEYRYAGVGRDETF